MDDPGSLIFKLILLFVLIIVNAFFAMSEIAIISLNDNMIDKMAEEGNKKARQVKKLTENPSNFLSTIQIGVTLAGFLTSASAATNFAVLLTNWFVGLGTKIPETVVHAVSVVLITIIISFFSLVLGELAPKRMAMQKSENEESVTEEEIRMMVDVGREKGVIEDQQQEMIDNIFDFDDIDVSDIMTHRTDMVAAEDTDSLKDVVKLSIDEGYSRIPIFHEDPDNIIGIIYIKDLLKYITTSLPKDKTPKDVMRKAYYVPFSKNCGELFNEMGEKRVQMAVVVDEYGGTAGIVTMEDLLEAIVGSIQDEYDDEDEEIVAVNDNLFTVDGTTDIEEINELVGDVIPEGDYETIGGFMISRLGYLPKNGGMDVVEFENLKLTILNVEDRRIGKVRVEVLPKAQNETEN